MSGYQKVPFTLIIIWWFIFMAEWNGVLQRDWSSNDFSFFGLSFFLSFSNTSHFTGLTQRLVLRVLCVCESVCVCVCVCVFLLSNWCYSDVFISFITSSYFIIRDCMRDGVFACSLDCACVHVCGSTCWNRNSLLWYNITEQTSSVWRLGRIMGRTSWPFLWEWRPPLRLLTRLGPCWAPWVKKCVQWWAGLLCVTTMMSSVCFGDIRPWFCTHGSHCRYE